MPETISLSNWTRSFVEYTGFLIPNPPQRQIESVIANCLPERLLLLDLGTENLLEDVLGITVVAKIGSDKIGWRTVTSRAEAELLQLIYSSPEYSRAKQFFEIDVYWLVIVNIEMLNVYTRGDLYEAQMAAYDDIENRSDCVIIAL